MTKKKEMKNKRERKNWRNNFFKFSTMIQDFPDNF